MALVLYCVGIIFFGLSALAFASPTLDTLINATARFSTAIQEQLATVQKDPLSAELVLVENTIAYAKAKTVYCTALREAIPELIDIAMGKYPRPVPLDKFAAVYSIVEERQDKAADEKTFVLLERFSGDPLVEKARAVFERAQQIEEAFHKDFDGIHLR